MSAPIKLAFAGTAAPALSFTAPVAGTAPTPSNPVVVGPPGPPGPPGPAGELVSGSGDLHYEHTQAVPSTTWDITHNLHKRPAVLVEDSAGDEVEGQIDFVTADRLVITFSAAFSGRAILN